MTSKKRNSQSITNPDIRRLCRIAGVLFVNKEIYDETRKKMLIELSGAVRNAVMFTEYSKRKTLSVGDVMMSLKSMDKNIVVGNKIAPMKKKTNTKKARTDGTKKPRHAHPGTGARREIKKFQKSSDKLVLQMASFKRLLRALTVKYSKVKDFRLGDSAVNVLQFYIENYTVNLLKNANALAVLIGNRHGIFAKDIEVAYENFDNMTVAL